MILAFVPLLFVAYLYSGVLCAAFNRQTARLLDSTLGAALRGWIAGGRRAALAFAAPSVPVADAAPPFALPCPPVAERAPSPLLGAPVAVALSPADALLSAWWGASPAERAEFLARVTPSPAETSHPLSGLPAVSAALVSVQEPTPLEAPEVKPEEIVSPAPSEAPSVAIPTVARLSAACATVYVRKGNGYRPATERECVTLPDTALYARLGKRPRKGSQYVALSELAPDADVA